MFQKNRVLRVGLCLVMLFCLCGMVNAGLVFEYRTPIGNITVDGNPGDWSGIEPIITDPEGDSTGGPGTDIKAVYLAKDNDFLYWRIDTKDGTFSFNSDTFMGPGIVFYDSHKLPENGGIPLSGVEAFIFLHHLNGPENPPQLDPGISTRYNNYDWTYRVGGPEYGAIGTVAEGKIPLSYFNNLDVNQLLVWYHGLNDNETYDDAFQKFSWFYDTFDGITIDPNKWNMMFFDTNGTTILNDVLSQNGTLQINGDIQNSTHYGLLNSKINFSGDFDIRASFSNWNYQGFNTTDGNSYQGPSLGLQINVLNNVNPSPWVEIIRGGYITNNIFKDIYAVNSAINGPPQGDSQADTTDTQGKLRLAREGSTLTVYYYNNTNSSWIPLNSYNNFPTDDVVIQLKGYTGYNTISFHGEFDDVEIVKGTITQGIVTGQVTDVSSGNPVANVDVWLTDANGNWISGMPTDSNGNYTVNAAPGSYAVNFNPNKANQTGGTFYLPQRYSNQTVNVNETKTINAQLQSGGAVSGKVTYDGVNGVDNVDVWLTDANGNWISGMPTDSSGNYTIYAAPGSYAVNFNPNKANQTSGTFYLSQRHTNQTVNANQTNTINAQVQSGGAVSGKVTYDGVNGVANVDVWLTDANGNWISGMPTDSSGNYTIYAAPGSYVVNFNPNRANQISGTYYLSQRYTNQAVYLTQTTSIKPQLQSGGAVSGYVTNSGQGISNIFVSYCDADNYCFSPTNTDSNGFYTLVAPAGYWKVQFSPQQGTGYYLQEWYDNQISSTTAGFVFWEDGKTKPGYDAQLETGGTISGRVTNAGGQGIPNVSVGYCDSTGTCLGWTQTGSQGNYTLNAPAGSWKVAFNPNNPNRPGNFYLWEWFDNKGTSSYAANLVAVVAEQTTFNINAQLEIGGTISGRVTNAGGQGITNVFVSYCDTNNYCYGGTSTDNNGDYTFVAPAGSWRVQFNPSNADGNYLTEWYNDKPNANNGDLVTVPTTGINAQLEIGGRISGRVTNSSGSAGIANVNVQVFSLNYGFITGCRTDGQGNYTLTIAPGTYKVYFAPFEGNYVPGWYNQKPEFNSSDSLTVSYDQATVGINAQLADYQTLTISGYVKDTSGAGIANVAIFGLSGSPLTDADGFYSGIVKIASGSAWSGMIIPGKSGYYFADSYKLYTNINTDQTGQDFTATVDTNPPVYYDQFDKPVDKPDLDPLKWSGWQTREIRNFGTDISPDHKLFSRTGASGSSITTNRLEIRNPLTVNHVEADVTVTEVGGNYRSNAADQIALPSAGIAGIFYNDGSTGASPLSYVGEVMAQIRIRPDLDIPDKLISEWQVLKLTNSQGASWEVLGSGPLNSSVSIGQTLTLSLDWGWDPDLQKYKFSFSDGINSSSFTPTGNIFNPANIGWKALRTTVQIMDQSQIIFNPDLWGKVSATFDNVKTVAGGSTYDDFSTNLLDLNKWATFEMSNEIIKDEITNNPQLISTARNGNINNRTNNSLSIKNPEQINEFQVRVTIKDDYKSGVSPSARIGGFFFNDTGDPASGYRGDIWAQINLVAGQNPTWAVMRAKDSVASQFATLFQGSGTFPSITIEKGVPYTLFLKWDGAQFIFKVNDYPAYYIPNIPIYQAHNPSRIFGTLVNPPNSNPPIFEGSITASFDNVKVGLAQFTSGGTNISTAFMDQTTGNQLATVTFSEISQAGMTSLTTSTQVPPLPSGFKLLTDTPVYYDISTGASFSGSIMVAISYNGTNVTDENSLKLLHFENGTWVDSTIYVDTVNKIIYGMVSSLSPFDAGEINLNLHVGDKTVREGELLEFVVSKDPVPTTLTYSATYLPDGATFDPATQTFRWTPTPGQAGVYKNILFTLEDKGDVPLRVTKIITITVTKNNLPVLDQIGPKSINEGDLLSFTVSATDPDGDSLTYSATNLPKGATFDPDTRTFSWIPDYTQSGSYEITFSVTDNGSTSESASETITITVGNFNRPPVLAPIGNQTIDEGKTLTFTITASDPDGDDLTYSAGNLPTGATFDPATQTFSWIPTYDQAGNYSNILFTVTDSGDLSRSASETITITVGNVNRPPMLAPIGNRTLNEGQLATFTITATDPDNNALTYSATNLPPGASFDPDSRTFSWTPDYTQAGNYPTTFSVTDNGSPSESASETITITVGNVNRPPVLDKIGNQTIDEEKTLTFIITASDPDGDTLTYSASDLPTGATFDPATQTFSWTPTFDQAGNYSNILFTVTDSGNPSLSASETITITVGNVNRPPVITSVTATPNILWPANKKPVNVKLSVTASDPDGAGDIVRKTYSVADEYGQYHVAETNLPSNGVISLIADRDGKDKDGRVYTITIKVYDSGGLSAASSVNVVVPHDQGKK